MKTTLELSHDEIREIFGIMRNDLEYRWQTRQKTQRWPLYDKFAEYLGENDSLSHVEYMELRREEEKIDEWREAVEETY